MYGPAIQLLKSSKFEVLLTRRFEEKEFCILIIASQAIFARKGRGWVHLFRNKSLKTVAFKMHVHVNVRKDDDMQIQKRKRRMSFVYRDITNS